MRKLLVLLPLLMAAACSNGDDPPRPSTTSSSRETTSTTERDDDDRTTTSTRPRSTITPGHGTLEPAFPPVIGGLGDSLLAGAEPEIEAQLGEHLTYSGDGQQGQKIQTSTYRLETLLDDRPAGTAVVLGTNNARDGLTPDDIPAVGELVEQLEKLPCVRWVEVSTSGPDESYNAAARALNAELHRRADASVNVDVVPWADLAAAHPEWVGFDRIHHTPAGAKALADAILDALAECPQTLLER